MSNEEKIQKIKEYISQCNGTDKYHLYNGLMASANLTDGVVLVCETAGAYWMIDLILSYQTTEFKQKNHEQYNYLQYWVLKVNHDNTAVAYMEFQEGKREIEQQLEYTDFPMKEFTWVYNTYDSVIALIAEG